MHLVTLDDFQIRSKDDHEQLLLILQPVENKIYFIVLVPSTTYPSGPLKEANNLKPTQTRRQSDPHITDGFKAMKKLRANDLHLRRANQSINSDPTLSKRTIEELAVTLRYVFFSPTIVPNISDLSSRFSSVPEYANIVKNITIS